MSERNLFVFGAADGWPDWIKATLLIAGVVAAGAAANLVGAFSIVGTWG